MRGLAHPVIDVTTGEWYAPTENGCRWRHKRLTFLISERCFPAKQCRFWSLACRLLSLGFSSPVCWEKQ